MSQCQPCVRKRRQCGSPFLGRPENSSFHLRLPGKFKASKQRRVRSCRDGSCDPQPAWGQCFMATAAVGHASPQTHSPPRDGTCQSAVSRMTEHEPQGKTPTSLHSLHRAVLLVPPKTGQRGARSWTPMLPKEVQHVVLEVLHLGLPSLCAELGDGY